MSNKKRKFYAVHGSNRQGIYRTWDECKPFCVGKSGVKYKAFQSEEMARFFAIHGRMPEVELDQEKIQIYTDGACKDGKVGGIGVYFPAKPEWNVSEPLLLDDEPTNQKAEIWAIARALMILDHHEIPKKQKVVIYTDSKYCFNILKYWAAKWKTRGWVTMNGQPVKNKQIIMEMVGLFEERKPYCTVEHVNSHCGHTGNEMADRLANEGCFVFTGKKSGVQ